MANGSLNYDPARRYDVKTEDVEYRHDGEQSWLALVYQPQGPGPFPALLDIHGGAWNNGDRTNNPAVAEGLAASGAVVVSIDFRCGGKYPYPSSLADINYATRWLKVHAADFHADAATVGGLGISSGGHLILLSAMRPYDPRYTALPLAGASDVDASLAYVIAAWPVIDPLFRFRFAKEFNRQELITAHLEYWQTKEAMVEGSPQTIIERDEQVDLPPLLMLLKANDRNHPLEMQERFIASYRKRGGAIEAHTFDGLPEHRMVPSPTQPETMRVIETITAFVRRQTG